MSALDPEQLDFRPYTTVAVVDGQASFRYPLPEPDLLRIEAAGATAYLTLDRPEPVTVVLRSRAAGGSIVEGSSGNRRVEHFRRVLRERNEHHLAAITQQAERLMARGDHAAVDALKVERDDALEGFVEDLDQAIEAMGMSAAVFGALRTLDVFKQRSLFESAHRRFVAWNPEAKMTRSLARLLERSRVADVGAVAPPFQLQTAEGGLVALDDYRGQWTLVDFWASWCLNCRVEMPHLVVVRNRWHARGFEILGITARDTTDAWRQAIADLELPWPNLWDGDAEITDRYLVSSQLPANFLIDPEGRIVARNLDAAALDQELADHLSGR